MNSENATRINLNSTDSLYLPFSSKNLNSLIGGGVEIAAITALSGKGGVGKSIVCLDVSFNTVFGNEKVRPNLPPRGKILYIDTEGSVTITKLLDIAKHRNIKIGLPPDKFMTEKKGLTTARAKRRYIRKSVFGQLRKKGFVYERVQSYEDYLDMFKKYFGELLKQDGTNLMIVSLDERQQMFLENVELVIIDSPTWLLIPQLQNPSATGRAYKNLYANLAVLSHLAHKYEFAAVITLQLISEMSEMLKREQGQVTKEQQRVLDTLQRVVEKQDYVGGKAAMHASTTNVRIRGDQNPRQAYNVKNRSKPTGELNHVFFEVNDFGIIDYID